MTLAEPTPVTEARILQQDLLRAGITPWAWVINNSLLAARPTSTILRARARSEVDQIATVASLVDRVAIVPLRAHEVVGETELAALAKEATSRLLDRGRLRPRPAPGVGDGLKVLAMRSTARSAFRRHAPPESAVAWRPNPLRRMIRPLVPVARDDRPKNSCEMPDMFQM